MRITVIKQIEWKTDSMFNEGKADLGLGHTAKSMEEAMRDCEKEAVKVVDNYFERAIIEMRKWRKIVEK